MTSAKYHSARPAYSGDVVIETHRPVSQEMLLPNGESFIKMIDGTADPKTSSSLGTRNLNDISGISLPAGRP